MVVTPHVKTNWVNESNNPPINETNLEKYDDSLIALADAHNALGTKKARAATTSNITLSGTQTVDGVALSTGQRCFVRAQTNGAQNGLYTVAAGAWTRAIDADTEAKFSGGTLIQVERGTVNGGKVFRCTNSGAITLNTTVLTFEEVGAGGGGTGTPGVYDTDGTTPLKYTAFLQEAAGNETAALQNAINALFANTAFNTSLDLEGATITLTQPVTIPSPTGGGKKSMVNGEIEADPSFSGGDHMIRCAGVSGLYYMRLLNVTMNGNNVASWIYWDIGNWMIQTCNFMNNKAGTAGDSGRLGTGYNRAGLFVSDSGVATGDAGCWIDNCWFSCDDGPTAPSSRWRWGIVFQTGDNKISGGTTMSYFRHSLVCEGPGLIITGFHPFQGQTGGVPEMTSHTAVIKLTHGRCGAQISGLYLGKGFMEISNEDNPTQEDIGEVVITAMRAYMDNAVSGEAHIHVRDYSGLAAGSCRVSDISIVNSYFLNGGSIVTLPTKLFNPAQFNRQDFHGVYMKENTFDTQASDDSWEVTPQANPCTMRKTLSSASSHTIDFSPHFPFGGNPQNVLAIVARGGSAQAFRDATVGNSNNVVLNTSASYSGDVIVTADCNKAINDGFIG